MGHKSASLPDLESHLVQPLDAIPGTDALSAGRKGGERCWARNREREKDEGRHDEEEDDDKEVTIGVALDSL